MANNHTNVQATNQTGDRLSITQTTTDSPILPAANLQQLKLIDPKLVDWVIEQTELEAKSRRKLNERINLFIFAERMAGPVIGGVVALAGLALGAFLIMHGHDWAGAVLCGTTLVSLVSVIVTHKPSAGTEEEKPKPKAAKKIPPKK